MKYGYARVSSNGQDYDGQVEVLKATGCERVYCDKASGKSIDGRREFDKLRWLPPGYVVAGGSRVHYAVMSSVLNLEDWMIPANWRLVREIANPLTEYRLQPLRIWEIGR